MRFAWLQKQSDDLILNEQSIVNRLILTVYNFIWWIPIVLTFIGTIDPTTGFISFAIITAIRLIANLYRNNILEPEQSINFPFRSP